ncbi:MAG: hypothetical protein IJP61_00850 [Treponema sp.]|nr:hypothetical protein [Treponema sp.]
MGAVRPLARNAVSGSFPGKQTVKDAGKPENMGFSSDGFIPVSFVFQGQYDAVWGLLPVEKSSTTADTKPLNSVAPATSMAVAKARVLRFSRLRIREREMRELPQSRRHALTMTKREAETCQSFLDVFMPYRPNGCRDSMANPNYLLLPSRRFGRHGALARENGKRREKTVQALYRLFVFPRRSIGCHSIFAS